MKPEYDFSNAVVGPVRKTMTDEIKPDKNGRYRFKPAGHTEEDLWFSPGISLCGQITDGVCFENGNEGGWIVDFRDLRKMFELAAERRGMKVTLTQND